LTSESGERGHLFPAAFLSVGGGHKVADNEGAGVLLARTFMDEERITIAR
jgi:hypothetical protein